MSLVDLYTRSVQGFNVRVGLIRPNRWNATTPPPEWDVRAFVNHVLGEEKKSAPASPTVVSEASAALNESGEDLDVPAAEAAQS